MKNEITGHEEINKATAIQSNPNEGLENLRKPSCGLSFQIIEMALHKSPTGGNSKPFLWYWQQDHLFIEHHSGHAAHYLNRKNHTSWIALGCLIESVRIAARSQDWDVHVEMGNDQLNAKISFTPAQSSSLYIPILSALLERSTFRGPLTPSDAPEIFMHHETTSAGLQVRLAAAEDLTKDFKKFIVTSETYIWLQRKASAAFFNEVRFFDIDKNQRGIRSQDLGVSRMDQLMLYCFSFIPWALSWIVSIPVLNFSFKQASKRNLKNAHFVLVTASSLNDSDLCNVGQAALRLWVDLEVQGYVVQPYSMASITLVDAATNQLPNDTQNLFVKLFTQIGPEIIQKQFNTEGTQKPVWLFRVGQK